MDDTPSLFILGSFVVACCAKVKSFPGEGECAVAESFTMEPGGKGFNLTLGARRLGAGVDGLFAIGDDPLAAMADAAFERAGLPPSMLRRFPGPTGAGIGFIDAAGETRVAVHPGANDLLSAEAVHGVATRIGKARLVLATFELPDAPILEAFTIARRAGAATILNPSPFRMPSAALLRMTSIVIVNETEGAALCRGLGLSPNAGNDPRTSPWPGETALFEAGPRIAVMTLGNRGALLLRHGTAPLWQEAFSVETIDTLGAGDAFAAAFAVALASAHPLETCARRAAAAAALSTTRPGVFDALVTGAEVDLFLKQRGSPL